MLFLYFSSQFLDGIRTAACEEVRQPPAPFVDLDQRAGTAASPARRQGGFRRAELLGNGQRFAGHYNGGQ